MADNDGRTKIRITVDTVLKRSPRQSSELKPSELYAVKAPAEYPISAWKEEQGHWKFTLFYAVLGGFNTWYVFKGHSQLVFAKPETNGTSSTTGPLIKIPGISNPVALNQPIFSGSSFTWAEATHGGTRLPPNTTISYGMVRLAKAAQEARDRIGRPFVITSWYRPPAINSAVGGAIYSRHLEGDGMDFYIDGLTGTQIYNLLDPWWPGGLGRYVSFPDIVHLDARSYVARWRY